MVMKKKFYEIAAARGNWSVRTLPKDTNIYMNHSISRKKDEGCEGATRNTLTNEDIAETMKGKQMSAILIKWLKKSLLG